MKYISFLLVLSVLHMAKASEKNFYIAADGLRCALISLNADISVSYRTKDGSSTSTLTLDKANDGQKGLCSFGPSDKNVQFNISFNENQVLTYNFENVNSNVFLRNITFVYVLPNALFPNAADTGTVVASFVVDQRLSTATKYYQCLSSMSSNFSNNVTLNTYSIKIKVFNVANSSFGDAYEQCAQDSTTSSSPSSITSTLSTVSTATSTKSTEKTSVPTTSTEKTSPPTTSTEKTSPPTTSTEKTSPPTTSTEKTSPPTTSTEKTSPPTTSTEKTSPPTTSTEKTSPPTTSTEKTSPPTTSTEKTSPPTSSTGKTSPPTSSTGKTSTSFITTEGTKTTINPTTITNNPITITRTSNRPTTVPPYDPKFSIQANGTVCLLVQGKMTVTFETKNKVKQVLVITTSNRYTGDCSEKSEEVSIYFAGNSFFSLVFTSDGKITKLGTLKFQIYSSQENIPNAQFQETSQNYIFDLGSKYAVNNDKGYLCNTNLTMGNSSVNLNVQDFKFEAFRKSKNETFGNSLSVQCSNGLTIGQIVSILLFGLTLAILLGLSLLSLIKKCIRYYNYQKVQMRETF